MATKATTKADGLTEFSAQELPKEELLEWYRRMSSIRAFENRLHLENQSGDIPGFIHLYAGEEAIAVGVCALLNRTDYIVSTHRGHGHCLAKGCNVRGMMLEIFGKQEGVCHGKGGSMHIADLSVGMLGANGIVGGGPSIPTERSAMSKGVAGSRASADAVRRGFAWAETPRRCMRRQELAITGRGCAGGLRPLSTASRTLARRSSNSSGNGRGSSAASHMVDSS